MAKAFPRKQTAKGKKTMAKGKKAATASPKQMAKSPPKQATGKKTDAKHNNDKKSRWVGRRDSDAAADRVWRRSFRLAKFSP